MSVTSQYFCPIFHKKNKERFLISDSEALTRPELDFRLTEDLRMGDILTSHRDITSTEFLADNSKCGNWFHTYRVRFVCWFLWCVKQG